MDEGGAHEVAPYLRSHRLLKAAVPWYVCGGRQEHMNLEGNGSGRVGGDGFNRKGPHRFRDWNAPWRGLGGVVLLELVWPC